MSESIECGAGPGQFRPVVDRNRCEGKKQCAAVCPYEVFIVATLPRAKRSGLSLRGKLNGFAHRWQQALVVNPDACHACGLCVAACPEKALTLTRA